MVCQSNVVNGERRGSSVARIRLVGDQAQAELVDLVAWLSYEDELRGRVSVDKPLIEVGEMGGLAEALNVAIGAPGIGAALVTSLALWIRHRRPSADIEVTNSSGRSVKVVVRDVKDDDLAEMLRQALED
ncbi:effector-associated constant component EACC1 [Nocardia asiatica]|uniref:effector-associated constant component EACC1 n=1 Tax=Nocardia asiatica TaxID=209252 RepID=UPI0024560DE6|nr:hypothetical protein [Nocardia asiatica]